MVYYMSLTSLLGALFLKSFAMAHPIASIIAIAVVGGVMYYVYSKEEQLVSGIIISYMLCLNLF